MSRFLFLLLILLELFRVENAFRFQSDIVRIRKRFSLKQSSQSEDSPISPRDKTKAELGFTAAGVMTALASSLLRPSRALADETKSVTANSNSLVLKPLPYAYDALEKHGISEKTLRVHHGKHHAKYVATTNDMVKGTSLEGNDLMSIILSAHQTKNQGLFNNAAQAFNHEFYWNCMRPEGGGGACPQGSLADAITASFGSHEEFRKQFAQAGVSLFGSGWVWLVSPGTGNSKKLEIVKTSNADVPIVDGKKVTTHTPTHKHTHKQLYNVSLSFLFCIFLILNSLTHSSIIYVFFFVLWL